MKYQVREVEGDPHSIAIDVDELLIDGVVISIDPTDEADLVRLAIEEQVSEPEGLLGFYNLVSKIAGLEHHIIISRYCIYLTKGALFEWENLVPQILNALQFSVAKDQKLEVFKKRPSPKKAAVAEPDQKKVPEP